MDQKTDSGSDDFQGDSSQWLEVAGDAHTVTSRERIRQQLARDIDEYLARGGQIQHLESHMRAEVIEDFGGDRGDLN